MSILSVAALTGAALLLTAWAILRERRLARERATLLSAMGFRPLDALEPRLAEPLLALYRRGRLEGRPLALRQVFRRDEAAGAVVVFDVENPGSARHGQVATRAVGLVRPGAGLPGLEVWSTAPEEGPGYKLVMDLLRGGLQHGRAVPLDGPAGFAARLTVLSTAAGGEEAVRRVLDAPVREALLAGRFLVLAAGGDAFALQGNPYSPSNRGDEAALLRKLIEDVGRLAPVLAGRR